MVKESKEIDIIEVIKLIIKNKKFIFKYLVIFTIIGFFISLILPKQYTSKALIIPQTTNNKISSFDGLAAIAGINIENTRKDFFSPNLYSKIVKSIPFKKELVKTKFFVSSINKEVTYSEYYKKYEKFNLYKFLKKYTIGLPGVILSILKKRNKSKNKEAKNSNIETISYYDKKLFDKIDEQLKVSYNKKGGYILLSFSMPEAIYSAQMAQSAQKILQQSIINFKSKKSIEKLNFIKERLKEVTKDYKKIKMKLAKYRDTNLSLLTSLSKSKLENLQLEFNLIFDIYSELAKNLEAQKIRVKEDTSTFTILEPISVPLNKSKPQRIIVIFTFFIIGLIISIFILIFNIYIRSKFKN